MKARMMLPACLVACMAVASCRPLGPDRAAKQPGSNAPKEQMRTSERSLSRERIIEIADAEARRRGCYPDEWVTIYDEGNAHWKSTWAEIEARRVETEALRVRFNLDIKPQPPVSMPEFDGRDYQVIIYRRRDIPPSGDLLILVDRNTGEVLRVIQQG